MEFDDEFSTSMSSLLDEPIPDNSEFFVSPAAFKFWFVVLLIFFLFISVAIFHFVCMGNQNVTRRNSMSNEKDLENMGMRTETTTMEMISEQEEGPSRLVLEED